jgi:hypothetical protein
MKYKKVAIAYTAVLALVCMYGFNYRHSLRMLLPLSLPDMKVNSRTCHSKTQFSKKVWLHRVNSISRAKIIQEKYKGLEMDVVYDSDKDCFDVHHHKFPSINLCFDELLQNLQDPQQHYFWLDFKNLESSNRKMALANLKKLSDKYKIKENIIVESSDPVLLSSFTDENFYTSYYLPAFNPFYADADSIKRYVKEIDDNLSRSRVNAISGYYFQYPFMEKYFPEADLLVWHIIEEKTDLFSYLIRERLILNSQIKVVLTQKKSTGYL